MEAGSPAGKPRRVPRRHADNDVLHDSPAVVIEVVVYFGAIPWHLIDELAQLWIRSQFRCRFIKQTFLLPTVDLLVREATTFTSFRRRS